LRLPKRNGVGGTERAYDRGKLGPGEKKERGNKCGSTGMGTGIPQRMPHQRGKRAGTKQKGLWGGLKGRGGGNKKRKEGGASTTHTLPGRHQENRQTDAHGKNKKTPITEAKLSGPRSTKTGGWGGLKEVKEREGRRKRLI